MVDGMKDLRACWVFTVGILNEMVYILLSCSLFLTETFPHQQTRPNVITLVTIESWKKTIMFLSMCKALSFLMKYNLAGLSYIDSLYYHSTLVCHRLFYPDIHRNAHFLCVVH